jgi:tetratricopeptide (TPR) repeat protein
MVRHNMPTRRRAPRLALVLLLLLSCSRQQPRTEALTGVPDPERARLGLAQIGPHPELPPDRPFVQNAPIPDKAAAHFDAARKSLKEKQWTHAIESARLAIEAHADYPQAHLLLARATMGLDALSTAQTHVDKALELAPRSTEAWLLSGDVAASAGRTDDAIHDYRTALLVAEQRPGDPFRVQTHLHLSEALADARYLNAAADELDAYFAEVDRLSGDGAENDELVQTMEEKRGEAAARLGDLRARLDQHAAAVAAYRRAMAERPNDRSLRRKLAVSLARAGLHDNAIDTARELLAHAEAGLDDIDVLREVCAIAKQDDAYAEIGIEMLAPIVEAHPAAPAAVALTMLYADRDEPGDCIHVMLRAIKADPTAGRCSSVSSTGLMRRQPANSLCRRRQ